MSVSERASEQQLISDLVKGLKVFFVTRSGEIVLGVGYQPMALTRGGGNVVGVGHMER